MKKIYKAYQALLGVDKLFKGYSRDNVQITGQAASDLILSRLRDDKPLMISRLGATELTCMINYKFISKGFFGNIANVLKGFPYLFKFNKDIVNKMTTYSGFFPSTCTNLKKFAGMSLNDLNEIDVLASWQTREAFVYNHLNKAHLRIFLEDLDAFQHKDPWTEGLKGKKVLVIHPFQDSIEQQYKKRELLFKDKRVLPEFELITLKAVQTLGGQNDTQYSDWFEALDWMVAQVAKTDFDVALLGAGAYGMPLAAAIKRKGKKAIHIGGSLQCLFGIKGSRWEAPDYDYQNKYYNKHWIRPLESEKPKTANQVENACYW